MKINFDFMKYLIAFVLIFSFFSGSAQNRFPSVDSAKNYVLRYVKNSAVETFTNWRAQNVAYGTLELLDSLAGNGAIDSIWKSGDTLKYSKSGVNYTIGTISAASDTATVVKAYVTNAEAVTITKGQVVYIFGASGDRASVKLAKNTSDTFSSKTLGIVRADIASGQAGWITTQGQVSGINLGAYTAGDILWLDSVAGGFTKVKPVAPYHSVFVGVVERANAGNGLIYVKPQNGQELGELHDTKITSPTNNQVLAYTAATDIWENKSVTTALGYTPLNVTDTAAMLSPYLRSITSPTGSGISLIKGTSQIKRLKAGSGISITDNTDSVTITSTGGGLQWDGADSLFSYNQVRKGMFRTYDFDGFSGSSGVVQGSGDCIFTTFIGVGGTALNIIDNNILGVSLSTGGSASSAPYITNGYVNNVNVNYNITGSNIRSTWMHFRVRTPTLNDGTQRFYTVIGFKSAATANPNDAAYFTYSLDGTETGSAASANWQCVSSLGGNREWTTTSSVVPANTWQTLSIRTTTTAVQFYIDGTLVATNKTRIPVTGRIYIQIFKTNGSTARFLDVDYATFNQLHNSDR
jgi:hypothetical protein